MKEINLTQGKVTQVSDELFDELNKFKWCAQKHCKTYYAGRNTKKHEFVNGKSRHINMHRIIWEQMIGPIPEGYEIDHKDNNGLNNLIENLRCVTHCDNMKNRRKHKNNISNYSGVRWRKTVKKWYAYINVNKKYIHLYCGDSLEDAIAARIAGQIKYHGEFAKIETMEVLV